MHIDAVEVLRRAVSLALFALFLALLLHRHALAGLLVVHTVEVETKARDRIQLLVDAYIDWSTEVMYSLRDFPSTRRCNEPSPAAALHEAQCDSSSDRRTRSLTACN